MANVVTDAQIATNCVDVGVAPKIVMEEAHHVAATLQQAGLVEATGYFERPKQVKATKTATGGDIKTDGRTLVIVLKP